MKMFRCGGLRSLRRRLSPRHLEYIDKSHCNLTVVTDDVLRHERHLVELNLESNHLTELPKEIWRMVKLHVLNVADNEIEDIPEELGNLTALEDLNVRQNDFRAIPESISKCQLLSSLDISNNTLGEVPSSITQLSSLKVWVCNDVALGEIPPEIGRLQNLVVLELRDNCIKFIPESFSFLANLERLDLGGNELEELPALIGQLSNLVELWVDTNFLTIIPEEIGELAKLQILDLSENRLEELPDAISGLVSLTDLIVSVNNLHDLPDGISNLQKLQILKADQNDIDELTDAIGGCTALTELILTDNGIEYLPASIGNLLNLSHLNIDRNKLFTFPPEIGKCVSLCVLSARDNQIANIPHQIGNCRSLTVLALSGNRLTSLPLSVSELPLKALWLSQNQSQSVLKLQVEDGEERDEKVLTCFLFPQEALKAQSIENFVNEVYNNPAGSKAWQSIETSNVHFENSDEEPNETHLDRQLTPYPKELRARHPNLVKRQRSVSLESDEDFHLTHDRDKRDESDRPERSEKPKKVVRVNAVAFVDDDDGGFVNPGVSIGNGDEGDDGGGVEKVTRVEVDDADAANDQDETQRSDEDDSDESGKRVGFNVDEDDASRSEKQEAFRLQRKDTPHFFKGKRLVKTDERTVQEILALVAARKSMEKPDNECDADDVNDDGGELAQAGDFRVEVHPSPPLRIKFSEAQHLSDSCDEDRSDGSEKESDREDAEESKDAVAQTISTGARKYTRRDTPRPADFQKSAFKARKDPNHIFEEDGEEEQSDDARILPSRDEHVPEQGEVRVDDETGSVGKAVHFEVQPEMEEVEIVSETIAAVLRRGSKGFGFSISGGRGSNPFRGADEGILVSQIAENGPAALDKRLQVGDKLLTVNGKDVRNSQHGEVLQMLQAASDRVSLSVCREKSLIKKTVPLSLVNGTLDVKVAVMPKTVGESTKAEEVLDARADEPKLLVEEVVLRRGAGPLGLSVVGGCDHACHPFGADEPGVFVSKISPDGEAAKSRLVVGDRILRVNGQDMRKATHREAVTALISNAPEIRLLVRHDPAPPGIQEVRINKKAGEKLGISIRGGANCHPGNPFDSADDGIFISKVNDVGAAARDGRLRVGMRILEVNNACLLGATHVDAVRALRVAGDNLTLLVCDGYDSDAAAQTSDESVLFNPAVCGSPNGALARDSAPSLVGAMQEPVASLNGHLRYAKLKETSVAEKALEVSKDCVDLEIDERGTKVKPSRSVPEQRAIDADRRAKVRYDIKKTLEQDTLSQVVVPQAKVRSGYTLASPAVGDIDETRSSHSGVLAS